MPNTSGTSPKRTASGVGLVIKKKRKRAQTKAISSSASVPSILTSVPDISRGASSSAAYEETNASKSDDEFGNDSLLIDASIINDTLLCLQTHTRSTDGMPSESCAYCPIFTVSNANQEEDSIKRSTHASPFLPKQVLIYLSSNHAQTNEDIKQLAVTNKVRLLQLHGTAIARNGLGWRGDGNDEEDVVVMETCAYEIASKMALAAHMGCSGSAQPIHQWFTSVLLPGFCGKTWVPSSILEAFIEETATKSSRMFATTSVQRWTVSEMKDMMKELSHSGLLLPKRGLGLNGGDGYWFSLPGFGKAANSIADGRLSILRRIQASKFKEKKRSTLEQEIGRSDHKKKDSNTYVQSGKFLVLDLLAKGVVHIHETCTGEQYVRIKQSAS